MGLREILDRAVMHFNNAQRFAEMGEEQLAEYYIHLCETQFAKYTEPVLETFHAMRQGFGRIRTTAKEIAENRTLSYHQPIKLYALK